MMTKALQNRTVIVKSKNNY